MGVHDGVVTMAVAADVHVGGTEASKTAMVHEDETGEHETEGQAYVGKESGVHEVEGLADVPTKTGKNDKAGEDKQDKKV